MASEERKEVVRIKVKKYDGFTEPDTKRFSIDPDITNFRSLKDLLATAFGVKSCFVISYLVPKRTPREDDRFFPMLSDWDLNTAIYAASTPQLVLKVDLKPFEQGLEEWDIIEADDLPRLEQKENYCTSQQQRSNSFSVSSLANRVNNLPSLLRNSNSAEPSIQKSQSSSSLTSKLPLNDVQFRALLDAEGRLICPTKLRLAVYTKGIEPSLRPVVWRHLLNVYPENMTGEERISYTKKLSEKYYAMKSSWQQRLRSGWSTEELRLIANAVRKDVVRTDRSHPYYSGDEEINENVLALFNILTTFALAHPDVAYCQGMSDLASPLLIVLNDEGEAYVCFCALMRRARRNFLCDGRAMTRKFQHLGELLQCYDPVFFEYLREMHAEDLLFCYRWLLLELKREFNFDDALQVLEVMWASMPPDPPKSELPTFELDLEFCDNIPFSPSLLHLPASNRAWRMLELASKSRTTSECSPNRSPPPTEDGSDSSENEFLPDATMALKALRSDHHRRSSDRTLQGDEEHTVQTPVLSRTVSSPHLQDSVCSQSCPGNLNGLCHAAVVRGLLLGKAKTELRVTNSYGSTSMITSGTSCDFKADINVAESLKSDSTIVEETVEQLDSFYPYAGRKIKPSAETSVADFAPKSPTAIKISNDDSISPVLIAKEAKVAVQSEKPSCELTLNDVYDICVGQISVDPPSRPTLSPSSSLVRSRQTSGDTNMQVFSSGDSSSGVKSRHASSVQTTQSSTVPDSGYSGATTPYTQVESLSCYPSTVEREFVNLEKDPTLLPRPEEFGDGNPFMMFICLTLLLEHRDRIMKQRMDFNEIAIYFDKLARRHSAQKILKRARIFYADYLRTDWFIGSAGRTTDRTQ